MLVPLVLLSFETVIDDSILYSLLDWWTRMFYSAMFTVNKAKGESLRRQIQLKRISQSNLVIIPSPALVTFLLYFNVPGEGCFFSFFFSSITFRFTFSTSD